MAYAAVISLKHTIEGLLHSSDVWVVPPSQKIVEFAYKEVKSLQEFLKGLDSSSSSERFNSLDGKIREAIYKLEDAIESHVSNQIASQSESLGSHPLLFSVDLRDLEKDICSFSETMKEYIDELRDTLPEEDDVFPSTIDFGGKESKFVGLSDLYNKLKDGLRPSWRVDLQVASVVGMAGIGKTALANEIVKDPYFMEYFDFRAWVTVGRKEIPPVILTQANPNHTNEMLTEGDQEIAQYLKESLNGKRCLIVLDDVWDKKVWSYLESLFPHNNNGSRVLLTTRLQEVARHTKGSISGMFHIRLLNEKESWDLLRAKVFGEESCPAQLEKAGKKIAENCDGLPLMIVTVANLLSEAEKTAEYWNIVAEKRTSVFMDAYDEISKVLLPSYECLPQYLKVCFLYMGVFPRNYVIPTSKLIKMWIAEGFLEPNIFQTSEVCAMKCLEELSFNSVVMPHRDSTLRSPMSTYLIKLAASILHFGTSVS